MNRGDVLALADTDYKFGAGDLVLLVDDVMHVQRLPDGLWLYVRGVRLDDSGNPRDPRQVLVRLSAIPAAIRHPTGCP
ncbi:hypothetical protein J2S43_006963 [Catenuloplanes nepalensis]|uniref:DUF3850 domain-containing protein n=1 Tax=Catenuloplanes nepalensis TaxID=587533 RepID=A0ABT9N4V2_9ACTN|nr:hypothetical protein [Catenuloplanes nepalensis]MDP9798451.1 hypothetical protein [Catenuloplanes nepalensis]